MSRITRRVVLRSAGAAVALPWLESCCAPVVAQGPLRRPNRFVTIYVPNGMATGAWTVRTEDGRIAAGPTLEPLAPHRDHVAVHVGFSTRDLPPIPAYHAAASTRFLTATSPSTARGSLVRAGTSIDQIAARALSRDVPLASLELSLEQAELTGACDVQYSCAYQNTICWSDPTTPLPMEWRPRIVFERMFGDLDQTPAARTRALRDDRSVLDSVLESLGRVQRGVSDSDRRRLQQYTEALRGVERRVRAAEQRSTADVPGADAVAVDPSTFAEHASLMVDLIAVAFHADITRVCTLMVGPEASTRPYPALGVSEGHHQVSHHQNDPEKLARLARINVEHVRVLAGLLERLRAIEDEQGSLLESTLVLYGAGLSDSNLHRYDNLPVVLAGPRVPADEDVVVHPEGTPFADAHRTVLQALGVPV